MPAKKEAWEQMIRGHQASRFLQDLVTSVSLSFDSDKDRLESGTKHFATGVLSSRNFRCSTCSCILFGSRWCRRFMFLLLVVGCVFQGAFRADDLNLKGTCIDGRHDQRSRHQSCILSAGFRLLFAQE